MRVCHGFTTVFDDPNLVSCAGLAPVLQLAERAGLQRLVGEHVELGKPGGVNAHLKIPALVAVHTPGTRSRASRPRWTGARSELQPQGVRALRWCQVPGFIESIKQRRRMAAPRKYPDELRAHAVRMAVEARKDPATRSEALVRIVGQLAINLDRQRIWLTEAAAGPQQAAPRRPAVGQRLGCRADLEPARGRSFQRCAMRISHEAVYLASYVVDCGMPKPVEVFLRNSLRRVGLEVLPTRRRSEVSLLGLHLSRLFDKYAIDVVLDVGARVGEYGIWLRQNGYRGWIVSFEPVQASFQQLQRCASADPLWHAMPIALGARDGDGDINVARMSQLSSLLPATPFASSFPVETQHVERIVVRRLDSVWEGLPAGNVYLKLDTQGYDLRVLDGAGERLATVRALQTEAAVQQLYQGAPDHITTLRALAELGFVPSGMFPVSLDAQLALIEYDCVAVRIDT